jgi:hypothetical protein
MKQTPRYSTLAIFRGKANYGEADNGSYGSHRPHNPEHKKPPPSTSHGPTLLQLYTRIPDILAPFTFHSAGSE